jgi:hypothetical protein
MGGGIGLGDANCQVPSREVRSQVNSDVARLVIGGWGDGWVKGCGEAQPGWEDLVSSLRARLCSRRAVIMHPPLQAGYFVTVKWLHSNTGGTSRALSFGLVSVACCGLLLADFVTQV